MSTEITNLIRGVGGMFFLVLICFLLSNNRKAINWKLVLLGIIAQIGFAIGVLTHGKYNFFRIAIQWLSDRFVDLINLAHKGIEFMFGNLADASGSWGYTFAIQALPNIIFFAALSALFYYLGILQKVVYFFALLLSKLKVSGAESVSTAANIFLGQTEAPLMVRPFLEKMNRSEILCIMVGGMANTAGSVLAAYVGFLGGNDPAQQHFFALHMLSQSIMSAPAAIVCSKILFPQTEAIDQKIVLSKEKFGDNALDAISLGTTDGLKLAVNVGAILIVFTALMYVLNAALGYVGGFTGINTLVNNFSNGRYETLSFQMILGYLFSPIAWVIGVSQQDMVSVGQLLGEKTIINEFQAYITFGKMKADGLINDPKSILITTYALCGFANIASIGIQIGGISQLAPSQRKNLTELGVKALIGGTIACLMCACIAGAIA
jgi:CNT family concentrative nucleoside transporter